jgi:hypothetical protein
VPAFQDVVSRLHGGGKVKGGTQIGGAGSQSQVSIPILADGSRDPSFDPITGSAIAGMTPNPSGFVSNCGHVCATALDLCGIPKASQTGRNTSPSPAFVRK